jgi:hypothetical protein
MDHAGHSGILRDFVEEKDRNRVATNRCDAFRSNLEERRAVELQSEESPFLTSG